MRRLAVIDIGSNSIKCLVAAEHRRGGIASIYENTLPVRIGQGIAGQKPRLRSDAIMAGAEAVFQLYTECQRHGPLEDTLMVATSAVRDASNGSDFTRLIYNQTGTQPAILAGEEEARLIGRGVVEDPLVLGQFEDFTVADLGGGSLELIALANETLQANISLPLGAVRLTEKFVEHPRKRMSADEVERIRNHARSAVAESRFPLRAPLIGCGGLVTVWRSMEAQDRGLTLPELSPALQRADLQRWIERIQEMNWSERLAVPGLPASRVDIILPGMLVIDTVLEAANAEEMIHSRFNLRFGIAADWFARHPRKE